MAELIDTSSFRQKILQKRKPKSLIRSKLETLNNAS
jgi:hypothetical protein